MSEIREELEKRCIDLSGLEGDDIISLWQYVLSRLNIKGLRKFCKDGEFRRMLYKVIDRSKFEGVDDA